MKNPFRLALVPCCNGECGFHVVSGEALPSPNHLVNTRDLLEGAISRARLVSVPLKQPDPGHSFAIRAIGSIEEIAEEPCVDWRPWIKRAYKAGYRAVRFDRQ